jgi:hypothetical protein
LTEYSYQQGAPTFWLVYLERTYYLG